MHPSGDLETELMDTFSVLRCGPVREPIEPCRRESGENDTVRLAVKTERIASSLFHFALGSVSRMNAAR